MRWFIALATVLFILIMIGLGLSFVARTIFGGDSSQPSTEEVKSATIEDVRTVKMTASGPIVATSEHDSYTIEVTSGVVSMKVYSDYGQKVVKEASYSNNAVAYENFIEALKKLNVTDRIRNTNTDDDFDDKGACADGERYIVEIAENIRRWTTNCRDILGTGGGEMNDVIELFNNQVPTFDDLVDETVFR